MSLSNVSDFIDSLGKILDKLDVGIMLALFILGFWRRILTWGRDTDKWEKIAKDMTDANNRLIDLLRRRR